ncbi:MAG TPA: hypothetical protein DIW37_14305 [Chryseobacterium sp.]|nr:hypothetical protein [Chryseobacterium sp.]
MQLKIKFMKKIIFILPLIIYLRGYSQITVTMERNNSKYAKDGNYIKDTQGYLDKFAGTWKYLSGSEEMIVKIEKAEHIEFNEYYIDSIFGGYKYTKDGSVKYDNLNFQYLDYDNPQNFADFRGSNLSNNYFSIGLNGYEPVGQRRVNIKLEILPNTDPVQMKWSMRNRENWVINGEGFKQGMGGTGIPKEMILIKQ